MLAWWGDVGSNVKTNDASVVGDVAGFSILPGSDDVYNSKTGAVGQARQRPELRAQHGLYRLGRLRHGRVSTATRRRRRRRGLLRRISAARTCRSGWRPIRRASSPTATPTSTFAEWVAAGYDEAFIEAYLGSNARQLQPSERRDRAAHPRHLPVLLDRRGRAGEDLRRPVRRPRRAPTPSPRPGRRSPTRSAATTRSSSTRPRSACKRLLEAARRRSSAPPALSRSAAASLE